MFTTSDYDERIDPPTGMLTLCSTHIANGLVVARFQWLQVGEEVKEYSSVNVQDSGVTKVEAEFRESLVVSPLK